MPIRMLIVDDTPLVREMQRALFEMEDDFVVCGEASDGREAVSEAGRLRPDVILLDWHMPGMDGVAALPLLRRAAPSAVVAMFSSGDPAEGEQATGAAGADAYLGKHLPVDRLVAEVRALLPPTWSRLDEHTEIDLREGDVAPVFAAAASDVLAFLRSQVGFRLWMVTRVAGDDWIILDAHAGDDTSYGPATGAVLDWSGSFCARMVSGEGPRVATRAEDVPAYRDAPIAAELDIGAYIGVPLMVEDQLFGTLCAIDPTPQQVHNDVLPIVELQARLLSSILSLELDAQRLARRAERAEAEATSDPLTGLFNRRGWHRLLTSEETRAHRYGHPAALVMLDLDGLKELNDREGHDAGDDMLRRAADVLRSCQRSSDVIARLGGDEFGLLLPETDRAEATRVVARIEGALRDAGVFASLGVASGPPHNSLRRAWQLADAAMYEQKRTAPTWVETVR